MLFYSRHNKIGPAHPPSPKETSRQQRQENLLLDNFEIFCSVPIIVVKYLPENQFPCLRVPIGLAAQEAPEHIGISVLFAVDEAR